MLSYGKVTSIGNDPAIEGILHGNIEIEEKLDGSQFRIEINPDGNIKFGSKSIDGTLDKMFNKGIEITTTLLKPVHFDHQITIFGEYFQSPKHNTLSYSKVPTNNICVFDIFIGGDTNRWAKRIEKEHIARDIGFDIVPILWYGDGQTLTEEIINDLLKKESYLGGTTLEGIVIKNYEKTYDPVKYPYMVNYFMRAKRVRKEFTELNRAEWGIKKGHIEGIIESLRTPQRFEKVYQHLRDSGKLTGNMRDLPLMIKELHEDILTENGEEIKNAIWNEAWGKIRGGVVKGMPEFYKEKLTQNLLVQEIKQ